MELDGSFRIHDRDDLLGDIEDRDRRVGSDIVDLAVALGVLHQLGDRIDDIVDVGKAAGLLAVVMDHQGLALHGCFDEPGQDHAIGTRLAGPDDVEETSYDDFHLVFSNASHA